MIEAHELLFQYGRVNIDYHRGQKYMAVRVRAWVKRVVDADALQQAYGGTFAKRMNGCLWTASNKGAVAAAAQDMHRHGGQRMKTLANLLAVYAQSKRGHSTRAAQRVMRVLQCRSAALAAIVEADSVDVPTSS